MDIKTLSKFLVDLGTKRAYLTENSLNSIKPSENPYGYGRITGYNQGYLDAIIFILKLIINNPSMED